MSATPNGNGNTPPERLAVLTAALLVIDDARALGLIDSGLDVDRSECMALLSRLKREGFVPSQDEAATAALELMVELEVIRR